MYLLIFCALLLFVTKGVAHGPLVTLDFGIFEGLTDTTNGVDKFYGLPFAEPPVGNLRLRQPAPFATHYGSTVQNATAQKSDCMQAAEQFSVPPADELVLIEVLSVWPSYPQTAPNSEDCLYLNVFRPSSATTGSKLPVLFWIYGGGFITGGISGFDGTSLVTTSIAMGQPIIFVEANYRLSVWGFLPGQEVRDAGISNLGLLDQRAALLWVNKYIHQFGGDPSKVTIAGGSAGSISVAFQMLLYGGESQGTFRCGIMESGSVIPLALHPPAYPQAMFDLFVSECGCAAANDKIQCLREVDNSILAAAADNTTNWYTLKDVLLYAPQVDGVTVLDTPQNLFISGTFAKVPIMIGDVQDEGTAFAIVALNVTDDAGFKSYLEDTAQLSSLTIAQIMQAYPSDPAQGSPYGTGDMYALTPQSKRVASVFGDFLFHGPRRYLSSIYLVLGLPLWTYLYSHSAQIPYLGAYHGTDSGSIFGLLPDIISTQMQTTWISFVNSLNPNLHSQSPALELPFWPQYGPLRQQLNFGVNGSNNSMVILDNYRTTGTGIFINNINQFIY